MRSSNEEVELDDAEGNNNGNGDQNGPEDTLKSTAGFLAEHFDLPKVFHFFKSIFNIELKINLNFHFIKLFSTFGA